VLPLKLQHDGGMETCILLMLLSLFLCYIDGVGNTVENSALLHNLVQQGHAGSKNMLQQNPLVLSWWCWITAVDLYNELLSSC